MKIYKIVLILTIFVMALGLASVLRKAFTVADKVTDPDHIIESYEEFQNMYNTVEQICLNISDLNDLVIAGHTESGGFSLSDRILTQKTNMNRWIEQYNSKSRQLTRNKWKNPNLPYQLSRNDFNCD